jgi:MFS family permease
MMGTSKVRIPTGVLMLGVVSMLMDVSSEMIHSLLPLFLAGALGVSVSAIGLIEGIAESTALISKVFSGALSDYLGRRKGLAVLGYGLAAVTKPVFALAQSVGPVVAARFIDRLGKGLRGAPRDALIADITPREVRGAAFGLRQSLDTVGAFVGPLAATALMLLWAGNFRAVFWVAVIPAFLSVALLVVGVREPERKDNPAPVNPISRASLSRLGRAYWGVVWIGAILTLARFSDAFLVLRASELQVPVAWVPSVMVAMNVAYAATAYPFGKMGDTLNRGRLLAAGLVVLVVADVVLALSSGWAMLGLGVVLWGIHMGMTQGLLAAMIADAAPADLRGSAFGFFNLLCGIAMLFASAIAGLLWDSLGSPATFACGALFAGVALLALGRRRLA